MSLTPLVLVLLALGVDAFKKPSHTQYFDLKEYGTKVIEFNRHLFYGLSGPDGFVCMNLTTTEDVRVSLGSCNQFKYIGKFESGFVAINKSTIDSAMQLSREAEEEDECREESIGLRFHTSNYEAIGEFNLFKCYEQRTRSVPSKLKPKIEETVKYKVVPKTWSDKYQDFPFQTAGDVVHHRLNMKAMLDAAALDSTSTVCFNLTGAPRVMVTLSRCKKSDNLRIYVTDEKVVGLDMDETNTIASLLHHKCPNEKGTHVWHLFIDTKEEELTTGSLAVYSCKRVVENNKMKLVSNAKIMGLEKTYFFSVHHFSAAVYSADLKGMMDYATSVKSDDLKVRVELDSTAPVSIFIGRCLNKSNAQFNDHFIIADWEKTTTMILAYEDLYVLETLSMERTCNHLDSDEALYFTVRTKHGRAKGSLKFSLIHNDENESAYDTIKTSVMFTTPKKMTVLKSLALEHVFDEALMNTHMLGFELNTTENVNLFVSKCRYSPRQTLVMNASTGLYQIRHNHQVALFRLFEDPNCMEQDGINYSSGYLHIEGVDEDAKGLVRFVTLNNGTKLMTKKFVEMRGDQLASPATKEVIAIFNNSITSNEFDLRYFVEAVRSEPKMSLYLEHPFTNNITVSFTKCLSTEENAYTLVVSSKHQFSLAELSELRSIMKSKRCDNNSRYGMFSTVKQEAQKHGKLVFTLGKYGKKLRRNEYILKNDMII